MLGSISAAGRKLDHAKKAWKACHDILPAVSRTFALTIPVLPKELRDSVCCAYLLCRIADTIEDHSTLSTDQRGERYRLLSRILEDPNDFSSLQEFTKNWPDQGARSSDLELIDKTNHVIAAFASLPLTHRRPIQRCVEDMVSGMCSMNLRSPQDGIIYVSRDLAELEQYCHYVAGTVGLMLTELFDLQLAGEPRFCTPERLEEGRRFGLALQLTNILKDQAVDFERGTSFLPREWLNSQNNPPALAAAHKRALIERTLVHLDCAEQFTLALPPQADGIRLFCLWAFWMAAASLREVATSRAQVPKISRLEVSNIINYTRQNAANDQALRQRYQELREAAQVASGAIY